VVALPLVLPLVRDDEEGSRVSGRSRYAARVGREAQLLLVGIPVLLWTLIAHLPTC